ncbi:hypothetical protein KBY30_02245 [Ruegeria pomeroyi]|nr:hypothetical protein [Ruegeria pomeroyi]MCE8527965.1 hypothetical protein [Ruegeria pomeroyi]
MREIRSACPSGRMAAPSRRLWLTVKLAMRRHLSGEIASPRRIRASAGNQSLPDLKESDLLHGASITRHSIGGLG